METLCVFSENSGIGHLAWVGTRCRTRKRKQYRDKQTAARRMTEENSD